MARPFAQRSGPDAPGEGEVLVKGVIQETKGQWRYLRGAAAIETTELLLEADEIDYNEATGDAEARGHVRYRSYVSDERLEADRVEYNMKAETGKFYQVRGSSPAKIDARPGILTTSNPFSFEGKWAERKENRYILYDGLITNCRLPKPWWYLRGKRFDIVPNQRALAYRSIFRLRGVPLFYAPVFYKSLERMPRKSGFLTPTFGTSSRRGFMAGGGYYWAINRSYDAQYRGQIFTQRGFAHTVDLRGKPRQGSDFNAFLYGVNDRGRLREDGTRDRPASGFIFTFDGRSELGKGWQARGAVNYLTSFRFRQEFTESFNEAIFTEVNSIGFITKHWSTYGFNAVFSRNENIQSNEDGDKIVIRRLPQFEFLGRDRKIWDKGLPLWFSFGAIAGAVRRNQQTFQTRQFVERIDVEPRIMTAVHFKDFHFIPSVSLRETHYGSSFRGGLIAGDNIRRSSREFTLEIIPPSLARVVTPPKWMGAKLKHVIEPRAEFRYVTGVQRLEDLIRFDEIDVISNTNQLEYSLTNRLYSKRRGGEVYEMLSWTLAQRRYFDPDFGGAIQRDQRNVVAGQIGLTAFAFLDRPRSYSPIVSSLRMMPIPTLGIEWRADYDPLRGKLTNSSITVDGRIQQNYLVSIGHTQVHCIALPPAAGFVEGDPDRCRGGSAGQLLSPPANQLRWLVGFGQESKRGWNGGFFGVYDYRVSQFQFGNTQITYNTDCCAFSVQYRRFAIGQRNENQFRFAFAVANLGSFGTLRRQERLF
ncbi:MAG: LPS assembly protein LptD [Bryobacteraceae bacterium]|nr:LPS assembly protein LptD [Bryobacteraceae bacterium]